MMKKFLLLSLIPTLVLAKISTETIYQGEGVVWSFAFIDQQQLLITHRDGKFVLYNSKTKKSKKLPTPNVKAYGQGGLLDVHYRSDSKSVYLTYSEDVQGTVTTALARAQLDNDNLKDLRTIFRAKVKSNTGRHFGSRLAFTKDHIFMTIGDRGERDYAQDITTHNGSVLRLNYDGTAAKGNPFSKSASALPEIWSYGHRNPQGIAISPIDGKLWSCEFGPRGGDELNLVKRGKNYGWPMITYGKEYWGPKIGTTKKKGMVQPITYWTPSISPSGMAFYTGDKISDWKNNIFLANLSSRHLRRLVLKDNKVVKQEELLKDLKERIRHVRTGPDGYLYVSTDSGKILKLIKGP